MPYARVNSIDLYYEVHGEGDPLLLIMGWGGNAATWKPQIRGLAKHYRVIAFDNRGAGRSSAPEGPYTTEQLARDAVGVLDVLGFERSHVFGISMGGMVAQELALAWPERVGALVLGCTSAGGASAPGFEELRADIVDLHEAEARDLDLQWFSDFLRHLWTEEALRQSDQSLQDFVFSLIRYPAPLHGLRAQADAVAAHDTTARLGEIRHPTLVLTGTDDTLLPPENSEILADSLPNGQLRLFPGLRHAFHLERPDTVNAAILTFLEGTRHG